MLRAVGVAAAERPDGGLGSVKNCQTPGRGKSSPKSSDAMEKTPEGVDGDQGLENVLEKQINAPGPQPLIQTIQMHHRRKKNIQRVNQEPRQMSHIKESLKVRWGRATRKGATKSQTTNLRNEFIKKMGDKEKRGGKGRGNPKTGQTSAKNERSKRDNERKFQFQEAGDQGGERQPRKGEEGSRKTTPPSLFRPPYRKTTPNFSPRKFSPREKMRKRSLNPEMKRNNDFGEINQKLAELETGGAQAAKKLRSEAEEMRKEMEKTERMKKAVEETQKQLMIKREVGEKKKALVFGKAGKEGESTVLMKKKEEGEEMARARYQVGEEDLLWEEEGNWMILVQREKEEAEKAERERLTGLGFSLQGEQRKELKELVLVVKEMDQAQLEKDPRTQWMTSLLWEPVGKWEVVKEKTEKGKAANEEKKKARLRLRKREPTAEEKNFREKELEAERAYMRGVAQNGTARFGSGGEVKWVQLEAAKEFTVSVLPLAKGVSKFVSTQEVETEMATNKDVKAQPLFVTRRFKKDPKTQERIATEPYVVFMKNEEDALRAIGSTIYPLSKAKKAKYGMAIKVFE